MAKSTADTIKRQGELEALRATEEQHWRDIARMIRPDGQDLDPKSKKQRDGTDCFDSAPLLAMQDFTGGLFGENVNPAERWMEFTTGDDQLDKVGAVQAWLYNEATLIFASLGPAMSSFYRRVPAAFSDTGAFGLGTMYLEEEIGAQRLIDKAIPLGELFVDTDANGDYNTVHRKFGLTGRQMKGAWGNRVPDNARDDTDYTIIHAVERNMERKRERLGYDNMPFYSCYVCEDLKDFRVESGYYELPYYFFAWNERSGRVYPTGPGHNARPDMNMLNEMARSELVGAQFAAEPILLATNESILTAADIVPNNVLFGGLNEKGDRKIDYLDRKSQLNVANLKCEQVRNSIREALHFSLWQIKDRPQMTATEFTGWTAEKFRLLGDKLVRVQHGLASMVARRYRMLQRAGQTTPPPPELHGRTIAVNFVSPMAKAQKAATGRNVLQWVGAIGQIAAAKQDMTVWDPVNTDGVTRLLHDVMAGDPDVIFDERSVEQMRKMRAMQQQQMMELQAQATQASTAADLAHAKQANTLADERTGMMQ